MKLSRNILFYGSDLPPSESVSLRAGPLSMNFCQGELRHIQFANCELISRIGVAIRSADWRTIPGAITAVASEILESSFRILFESVHREDPIDFVWRGCLHGEPDGRIRFSMDGASRSSFLANRIGLCVLHPADELAGQPCTIESTHGLRQEAAFPLTISPHQPFLNVRALSYRTRKNAKVAIRFNGDIFETEDQRNWTDPSFKTYAPPLVSLQPSEVPVGAKVFQEVVVTLDRESSRPDVRSSPPPPLALNFGAGVKPLPLLGLTLSATNPPFSATELNRLRALNLAHLRVDLNSFSPTDCAHFDGALQVARQIGAALEVALFYSPALAADFPALREYLLKAKPPIARWLVVDRKSNVSTENALRICRQSLADCLPSVPFGGGTDGSFAEINRNRESVRGADFVNFSMSPQVHAFDHETIVENLPMQREVVRAAASLAPGLPVSVSTVSLRPRFLLHDHPVSQPPGSLPFEVDPRQLSLLGGAWTVGSLKHLSEADVHSVTYYETVGWKGVMESQQGSALPDVFPSIPGSVFPLYHVLADVGELAGGSFLPTSSSNPRCFEALALRKDQRIRVLLANLTPQHQSIDIRGAPFVGPVLCRQLHEATALSAMTAPESFRNSATILESRDPKNFQVELSPFDVMTLDSA